MRTVLTIDLGGTTTVVSIFGENGVKIASKSISVKIIPQSKFIERNATVLWQQVCCGIQSVIKASGVNSNTIAGVSFSGHGKGIYPCTKEGTPTRNAIMSADTRGIEILEDWRNQGVEEFVVSKTAQPLTPSQIPVLIQWMRLNEPLVFAATDYFFSCKDYIRFKLTGVANSELTDASSNNLIPISASSFDDYLLDKMGLNDIAHKLPSLCNSFDLVGGVTEEAAQETGLVRNTPVFGGVFDINACSLATGVVQPDELCIIAGTWGINQYLDYEVRWTAESTKQTKFCISPYILVEESSPTSAGNLNWFIRKTIPLSLSYNQINNAVAEAIKRTNEKPFFVPFLMGSINSKEIGASMVGINQSHELSDIIYSIFEGVVFAHRIHIENLKKYRTSQFKRHVVAGGLTNSDVWMQLFSNVLSTEIESLIEPESGTYGAAIATIAAIKYDNNIPLAISELNPNYRRFYPDDKHLNNLNRRYKIFNEILNNIIV